MHGRAWRRAWPLLQLVALIGLGAAVDVDAQQSATGTLTGTVVDSTKASVPGATASAIEGTTGAIRTGISNEQGLFRIPALPPGRYSLRVELSGFRSVTVTDILLVTTEVRDVGTVTLQLGEQTEEVTVTAGVTPVQVRSSSRYSTVMSEQLTNIQMKGRDIYGLMAILPGVQDTNLNRDFTTWTSMRDVTINGAPVVNKNIVVDGVSVVDEGGAGNAFVNPNIDAVGEVQVIANGFTAENGRSNGGLINMTVKSGTSELRGSGWYNARRDKWNANDYLRKREGLPKPLYRVNISGYSVGGPVVIPKLFDSRKSDRKLFFFASQEFTDDARPSEVVRANLPTEMERRGNFSGTRLPNGDIQPIIDPRLGRPFPGNIIPSDRIDPTGQALLNLLPTPNGITNLVPGEEFTSNSAFDETPLHSRTNHVLRIDGVLSQTLRASFTFMRDREDNWRGSDFAPGLGWVNNFVPGWIYSGKLTHVLSSSMVNEITVGFGHNNYGFKGDYDYTQYYCANLGVCPPRLEPFGAFQDPPAITKQQADEYPYIPQLFFEGGNREGLASYSPGTAGGRVMPAANRNDRWSFQDDLSITRGSHNLKFGVYGEYTLKTEPGSTDYMGNFDFGSDPTNPLDTGNGYANALLGVYTSYTELSNRVDSDRRHWQVEGYLQDSWRVSSGFTLDYGVRLTHSGPYYEVNDSNSGFFDGLWDPAQAPLLYQPVCLDGRPGNQPCPQNLRAARDPAHPDETFSYAFVGNIVPGTGTQTNGMRAGGIEGGKPGQYYDLPYLVAAPRVGFAWDLTGDGKTALRASGGIFYNYLRNVDRNFSTNTYGFLGSPPVTFSRVVRNGTLDDVANAATGGVEFVEGPIDTAIAGGDRNLERSYNVNVALQRDIGFNTTVEAAYVGNFTRHSARNLDLNRIPLYAYGDPNNLFNNEAIDPNFLRTTYPGMGEINRTFTDIESLRYHALQLNFQRRMSEGLQFGAAYTLSKGEGMRGYDPYTEELGGEEALKARYWGPTDTDRRHNLVVYYTYLLPSPGAGSPLLEAVLGDWQVSGVTKFLSGTAVNPTCASNNQGIANTDPSLTGVEARCMLTGEPIHSGFVQDPDPAVAVRFNTAAFAMAQPFSATEGNFGNAPLGLLRNPSWSNWDVTLAKRFPLPVLGDNAQVRVQFQAYNIFNQVQFTELDAAFEFTGPDNAVVNSATTGRYIATIPPRQLGLTLRLDF